MKNQTPSIEQMKQLQSLGVVANNANAISLLFLFRAINKWKRHH